MPAADAAGRVGLGEGGSDAAPHLDAEFGGRPAQRRRLAEQDAIGGDAVLGPAAPEAAGEQPETRRETRLYQARCSAPAFRLRSCRPSARERGAHPRRLINKQQSLTNGLRQAAAG